MPELPEVETVRRTLEHLVVGKEIRDIDVYYDKTIRNVDIDTFKNRVVGTKINSMKRFGKHLVFDLGEYSIVSHLRMEGKYYIKNTLEERNKHEHVLFYFTDGETLRYHDTRKFGTMDLILTKDLLSKPPISKIGYEPFDHNMTKEYLFKKLSKKNIAIKKALLDQSILAGLGNIYVDEVLFRCKFHPTKNTNTITINDCELIIKHSIDVLQKAIDLGGTTIKSYTSSLGVTGLFQNDLFVHTKAGEPCVICNTIISKIKVGGRGTYYCKKCQKE